MKNCGEAVRRVAEETRMLYVAMTRAVKQAHFACEMIDRPMKAGRL